ncbi:GntR family transcriptional regulator [Streptomyces sp. NBC_01221]|uniref:GntR family transcriptional regulator n=1 Tax=Streptomyces sp. NBC_01221 TaxID=2903782 RepID=UPI0022587F30|nr:GntR family transcriptional regulator [Streptomyces sp. NBC_01221]MCX4792648.1 GntR family transcriptional regulator [Streptomyces sp. NBC_01221]
MTSTKRDQRATARSIADALREQIRAGELRPGATLPTSRELSEQFGVTSKTVSAGIDLLKLEGLVIGEQGGRRRVRADRPITWNLTRFERGQRRDSVAMDDWSTAIKEAGREPAQVVTVTTEASSAEVAEWLRVAIGSPVVKRVRMRSVDSRPFQLSTSWFPESIAAGTPLTEEGDVSMPGGILKSIGHPQRHVRDEITVRMPTPEESDLLALPPGTPVAQHVRIGFGEEAPVRVMKTIAPGDRHMLVYEMEV